MADGDAIGWRAIHRHAPPIMSAVSSKDFTAIADAVEWVVRQDGVDFILHYLDNFYWLGMHGCPHHHPLRL